MTALFICVAVLVALAVIVAVGHVTSIDRSREHTRETDSLPLYTASEDKVENGLLRIAANDMEFRARVRNLGGEGEGVILLHGWPQSSIAWEPLLESLAEAGYQVAAVDQRGYSPGARPDGMLNYSIASIVDDVFAIADALGFERFHLAGHDWGAAAGWGAVMTRPERIRSWSALSIPHSVSFVKAVQSDPAQRKKSAYSFAIASE